MINKPKVNGNHICIQSYYGMPALLLVLFLLLTTYFAMYGPRLTVNEGFGWDGLIYGRCALDILGCVQSGGLSEYKLMRLFPSALVNVLLIALDFNMETVERLQIVRVFSYLNLLFVLTSLFIFLDCARRSSWSVDTAIFGVASLFFSFSVIRFPFYAPVATDAAALFFSCAILWCYVAKRYALGFLILIPAGMTWPVAVLCIVLILGTKTSDDVVFASLIERMHAKRWVSSFLVFVGIIGYTLSAVYFIYLSPKPQPHGSAQVIFGLIPISLVAVLFYIYRLSGFTFATLHYIATLRLHRLNVTVILVVVMISYLLFKSLIMSYSGGPSAMNVAYLWRGIVTTSLIYPGLFIVAHVVFFGPWILVYLWKLPVIINSDQKGLLPVLILSSVFFMHSESRFLTFFVPFMVFALCRNLDGVLNKEISTVFAVFSLLSSRPWLDMEVDQFGDLLDYPAQILFMHIGPWMSLKSYGMNFVQVVVSFTVLAYLFSGKSRISIKQP